MALRHRSKRTSVRYTHDGGAFLFSRSHFGHNMTQLRYRIAMFSPVVKRGLLCPGHFHHSKDGSANDRSKNDLEKTDGLAIGEIKCGNGADR